MSVAHDFARTVLCLVFYVLTMAGCHAPDPGQFSMHFVWKENIPKNAGDLFAMAQVRALDASQKYTVVLATAGPVALRHAEALQFDNVPYGSPCAVYVELRATEHSDQSVLYYGISDTFDLHAGDSLHPSVRIPLNRVLSAESTDAVRTVTRDQLDPVTITGTAQIDLLLHMNNAVQAHVANSLALLEHQPAIIALNTTASTRVPWNVEEGINTLDPCVQRDCSRYVYVRFIDVEGYASQPISSHIALDRQPPAVRTEETRIEPVVAQASSTLTVHLAATEDVDLGTLKLALQRDGVTINSDFVHVTGDSNTALQTTSNASRWALATPLGQILQQPGVYDVVLLQLMDLHGNRMQEDAKIIGTVTYDPVAPVLSEISVPSEPLKAWDMLRIGFVVDEPNASAAQHIRVMLADQPLRCTTRAIRNTFTGVDCRILMSPTVPFRTGSETILPLTIQAWDGASNQVAVAYSIVLDAQAPIPEHLPTAPLMFVPQRTFIRTMITWSEPLAEIRLIAVQHDDVMIPDLFTLEPISADGKTVTLRSITPLDTNDAGRWTVWLEGIDRAGNASGLQAIPLTLVQE